MPVSMETYSSTPPAMAPTLLRSEYEASMKRAEILIALWLLTAARSHAATWIRRTCA
jgi:hypothetical protein